jgi:myo-inositol catabolism protein IolC
MTLGYDKPLYVLAFDHRGSFQKKFFGVTGVPNAEESARIADAKQVIFEGALESIVEGAPLEEAGIQSLIHITEPTRQAEIA